MDSCAQPLCFLCGEILLNNVIVRLGITAVDQKLQLFPFMALVPEGPLVICRPHFENRCSMFPQWSLSNQQWTTTALGSGTLGPSAPPRFWESESPFKCPVNHQRCPCRYGAARMRASSSRVFNSKHGQTQLGYRSAGTCAAMSQTQTYGQILRAWQQGMCFQV